MSTNHNKRITNAPRIPGREVLGLVILLVGVAGSLLAISPLDTRFSSGVTIDLVAETPGMERGQGGWHPRVIRVRSGELVQFRLTSRDVTHGFLLPDLGIKTGPVTPGQFLLVSFVPKRPGIYIFYCYILCGPRHGAMNGRLVVE